MAVQIKTGRGIYMLAVAAPPEKASDSVLVTIAMERADGIERIVMRCRIAAALLGDDAAATADRLIEYLAPWFEREFEQTREAALKSIRAERKLWELSFDTNHRGPF
ncbi:MAG: hypothetical protein ACREQN_19305 [Candidatus Binataceae bacterium]